MFWRISYGQLGAELMGDDAAHGRAEVFAGFFVDERAARFVPTELEAGGKRGDPDFADGRVGRNHELDFLRLLEEHLEFSRFPFDDEAVLIAPGEHPALEGLDRGVRVALTAFFCSH